MTAVTATVSAETLPAMIWQQARVITTELLAKLYGAADQQIRQNFNNNTSRFVEGTHFFKLEGDALRAFKKNCVEMIDAVPKHTRSLILWTERGAARHAKMLDTEAAWEVFEKLEDCYFRAVEAVRSFAKNQGDVLSIEQADLLRNAMTAHCARLPKPQQGAFMMKGWSKLKSHFKVSYRQIPQEQLTEALSMITRHATEWEVVDEPPAVAAPTAPVSREALLMDALSTGRWLMTVRDGRLVLKPIDDTALVVTGEELPRFLSEPCVVSIRHLPAIVDAASKRLNEWVSRQLGGTPT